MKKLIYTIFIFAFILSGCVSTEQSIKNNSGMSNIKKWNITLRYNSGAKITSGNEVTDINTGNSKSDLKLIDDIKFEMEMRYKDIIIGNNENDGNIYLTTSRFKEVDAFKTCDIYFYDKDLKAIGRIEVKNSEYAFDYKNDNEFAKLCADEIYKAIKE